MPDLWDFLPPVSHRHDPATSREAGDRVTRSGARARHARLVLDMVKAQPGLTAVELYEGADPDTRAALKEPQECRRRLTDLHHAGLVRQGEQRACRRRGTTMVTWYAVGQTEQGA